MQIVYFKRCIFKLMDVDGRVSEPSGQKNEGNCVC